MNSVNIIPPEKLRRLESIKVPVHETFLSIEGEGPDVGTPTVFIRLAVCNFRCPFCDTRRSWDEGDSELMSVTSLLRWAEKGMVSNINRVSITGGNPVLHEEAVIALVDAMQRPGRTFNLEHPGILGTDPEPYIAFINRLIGVMKTGNSLSISMDVKYPLWSSSDDLEKHVQAHRDFLLAIAPHHPTVTASIKVLAACKADFEAFATTEKILRKDLEAYPNLTWWVAPVRCQDNKVNRLLLGVLTEGITYHPSLSMPWRINPNLHIQLGLR